MVSQFIADPSRLLISSIFGIIVLLVLIVKFKIHPILSLLVSALCIGLGSGMSVLNLMNTIESGAGETLQGIVLLIGLGSMFGGILEVSGGAQSVARTLIDKVGEDKAGLALGITGLVVGTTVFFEAGVVILIPLAFGLAKKTKKSTLFYVMPLLAGLATSFAFIPPSSGSVLVSNILGVDLGVMIAVGLPIGIIALIVSSLFFTKFIGKKIFVDVPSNIKEVVEVEKEKLPSFYIVILEIIMPFFEFLGTPFIALIIAVFSAMFLLGKKHGYNNEELKQILDRSLRPTGQILLVITGGGIISYVLQGCGMGKIIAPILEKSGLPLILIAFLISGIIRISVGAAVVSMTMAAGIMATIPSVSMLSQVDIAAMVCAINGGATAFSHFNDSGFWLVSSLIEMDEKTTLKTWTILETIIGFVGLVCAILISVVM